MIENNWLRNRYHIQKRRRQGTVLICMLACVLISTTLASVTIHSALISRKEARLRHRLQQTEWLLDAGIQRAKAKLGVSSNYAGERWDVPAQLFPAAVASGVVEIAVSATEDIDRSAESSQPRLIVRVRARLNASREEQMTDSLEKTAVHADYDRLQRSHEFVFAAKEN